MRGPGSSHPVIGMSRGACMHLLIIMLKCAPPGPTAVRPAVFRVKASNWELFCPNRIQGWDLQLGEKSGQGLRP